MGRIEGLCSIHYILGYLSSQSTYFTVRLSIPAYAESWRKTMLLCTFATEQLNLLIVADIASDRCDRS